MPSLESLMAETVGHDMRQFKTDTVRYYPDASQASPGVYTVYDEMDGVVNPQEDQNLNEGNADLQFDALILNVPASDVAAPICHGDAANLNGGDRVKLSRDSYASFWFVKRILSKAGGELQLMIVDNGGAIV